uniref:Putative PLP-dependent transferase n=1 Tax=Moniliophthora roreri TaxID=221103 RepID=A0A0W0G511_MONRR
MPTANSQTTTTTAHTLPHRLNSGNLLNLRTYAPIPIAAIPVDTPHNLPFTRPSTIDHRFEIWNPPFVIEEVDYAAEAPDVCEAPCCYTPKQGNRRPVGVLCCHHPDMVDETIEYYVCKQCYGLRHHFCGMEVKKRWRIDEPTLGNEQRGPSNAASQPTTRNEDPQVVDWWKDPDEWAEWRRTDGPRKRPRTD